MITSYFFFVKCMAHTVLATSTRKLQRFANFKGLQPSLARDYYGFHHGGVSVRKSVSVHGVRDTLPSTSLRCASARESGAGPRITLPVGSYCEPWHGHMYLFAARFHGTTQPRWVQTALRA